MPQPLKCYGVLGLLLGGSSPAFALWPSVAPNSLNSAQVYGASPAWPGQQVAAPGQQVAAPKIPSWQKPLPKEPADDPDGELHATVASKYIGHVPMYGYDRVTSGKNKYKHWLISFPQRFTTEQLRNWCKGLATRATCTFIGHPSENGLPVVHVEAEEYEMGMRVVSFPGADYVEADGPMHMLSPPRMGRNSVPPGVQAFRRPFHSKSQNSLPDFSANVVPPAAGVPWGLDRIDQREGLDGSYNDGDGGAGVHIYVMDTGVDTKHPDFGGRAVPTIEAVGGVIKVCDPLNPDCAFDVVGHGTHTAGIVASDTYGVAHKSTIHAVKVLNEKGGGAFSWLVTAIDWVLSHGMRPAIITASLGGDGKLKVVKDSIESATSQGISVVVAAGNEGADACQYTPSYVPAAFTVGSVDDDDGLSSFSNYGKCVDIFAPGTDIESISPGNGLSTMSGTSMSAPYVAGAVALAMANVQVGAKRTMFAVKAVVNHATKGVLRGLANSSTPNRMLFTGELGRKLK